MNPVSAALTIGLLCLQGKAQSPHSESSGSILYCGQDVNGERYFFSVPERFSVRRSRSRDEYFFRSSEGETLSVAFIAQATPGLRRTAEEESRAMSAARRIVTPGGATVFCDVSRATLAGMPRWVGIGSWSKDPSYGGVDMRSGRPKASIEAEIARVCSSVVFDRKAWTERERSKRFKNRVKVLRSPRDLMSEDVQGNDAAQIRRNVGLLTEAASYFDIRYGKRAEEAVAVRDLLRVAAQADPSVVRKSLERFWQDPTIKFGKSPTVRLLLALLFRNPPPSANQPRFPFRIVGDALTIPEGYGFGGFILPYRGEFDDLLKRRGLRDKAEIMKYLEVAERRAHR